MKIDLNNIVSCPQVLGYHFPWDDHGTNLYTEYVLAHVNIYSIILIKISDRGSRGDIWGHCHCWIGEGGVCTRCADDGDME